MQKYKSNLTSVSGAAVRGASVTVLDESGATASIFLDRAGTLPAGNPLKTAQDGTFEFYAANGRYSLRTDSSGLNVLEEDVIMMFDPVDGADTGPIAESIQAAQDTADQASESVDQLRVDLIVPTGVDPAGGFASADDLAAYSGTATFAKVNANGEFGWYVVDPSDTTSTADRGSVVVDANSRRWKRVNADTVKPEMFWLTNTPAATAVAFNAAANYCRASGAKLIKGAVSYTLGADVNLRSVRADFSGSEIIVNDGSLLTIGGNSGSTINPEQVFGSIKKPRNWSFNPADYPTASVRVMGSKGQTIRISHVDRIQFYQSTNPATYPADASQAYSKFFIDFVCVIDIDTDPAYAGGGNSDGPGSANQWFNANQFTLGRNVAFLMRGSYPHNDNKIHGGTYETANSTINIQSGNKNWFTDVRFEGAVSVVFGASTLGNIIDVVWFSSTAAMYQSPPTGGTKTNDGKMNLVRDIRIPTSASDCVMLVTAQDTIHNGQPANYNFRAATRLAIRGVPRTTARIVAESEFIDARASDYFFASVESRSGGSSSYILRIYLYDAAMSLIAGNAANLDTSNFTSIFSDRAEGRVNDAAPHHRFGILNSSVRYVRMELLTSGSASEDNGFRMQVNRVSLTPGRSREAELKNSKIGRFGFVTSTPTQFVGKIGDPIAGFATDFRCIFALETTLSVAAASSANVVTTVATTITGIGAAAIGDLFGLDLDDGTTHWTTISAIGGGNITLTAQLPSAAAAGSRAYISRLSTR